MDNNTDIDKTNAFADGCYRGIPIVAEYLNSKESLLINGVLKRRGTKHRDDCLKLLFMRAKAWMQTLIKLNHGMDFQALGAANRALLEIVVDIYLLHHDKSDISGQKMFWWMKSELIKIDQIKINYYNTQNLHFSPIYQSIQNYITKNKSQVEKKRSEFWSSKHPKRWTGKSGLIDDIPDVDEYFGDEIKGDFGYTLTELYYTLYHICNWLIHSGIAGFSNMPPEFFELIGGLCYKYCADLGMLSTKVLLTDFGFVDVMDDFHREWDEIKTRREKVFRNAYPQLFDDIPK